MLNFLWEPNKNQTFKEIENSNYECIISEVQGWRITNEDSFIADLDIEKNISLFAVFDGHCGDEISKFCEKYYKEFLMNSIEYKNKEYENALKSSIIRFDQYLQTREGIEKLNQFKIKQDDIIFSGTTAVICLIVENESYIANLGDSRCVIYNIEKGCIPLTYDHKPDNIKEKERIENAGGFVSFNRINEILNISRTLGDFEFKKNKFLNYSEQLISCVPEIIKYKLTNSDDFIILGCDGLWEKLNDIEVCNYIKSRLMKNHNKKEIIHDLINKSIAENYSEIKGLDNITIIFINLK